jgi:hypothetical protein
MYGTAQRPGHASRMPPFPAAGCHQPARGVGGSFCSSSSAYRYAGRGYRCSGSALEASWAIASPAAEGRCEAHRRAHGGNANVSPSRSARLLRSDVRSNKRWQRDGRHRPRAGFPVDGEQSRTQYHAPLFLEESRPDGDVDDTGFVFERRGQNALGRPRPLADRDKTRRRRPPAVRQRTSLGACHDPTPLRFARRKASGSRRVSPIVEDNPQAFPNEPANLQIFVGVAPVDPRGGDLFIRRRPAAIIELSRDGSRAPQMISVGVTTVVGG